MIRVKNIPHEKAKESLIRLAILSSTGLKFSIKIFGS